MYGKWKNPETGEEWSGLSLFIPNLWDKEKCPKNKDLTLYELVREWMRGYNQVSILEQHQGYSEILSLNRDESKEVIGNAFHFNTPAEAYSQLKKGKKDKFVFIMESLNDIELIPLFRCYEDRELTEEEKEKWEMIIQKYKSMYFSFKKGNKKDTFRFGD